MTKPIQIRSDEVVRDIREVAQLTNRTLTDIVGEGVRLVLEKERARRRATRDQRDRKIDEIMARVRALPRTGEDLTDADLYDEDGLPR